MDANTKKALKNTIAHRLKEVRKGRGVTQADLALAMACTQGLVAQYEAGLSNISIDVVFKLCDALECSIDYLMGRDIKPDPMSCRSRVISAMEKLDTQAQIMIVHMVEGAAANYGV